MNWSIDNCQTRQLPDTPIRGFWALAFGIWALAFGIWALGVGLFVRLAVGGWQLGVDLTPDLGQLSSIGFRENDFDLLPALTDEETVEVAAGLRHDRGGIAEREVSLLHLVVGGGHL
jgi:hypothetical protein